MRRSSMILGIVILAAIGASLIYLAVTMERASSQHLCWVCSRPLHERSSTVVLLGDKREMFCCPSCALAAHRQTGKVTQVLKLTDYETDSELDPQDAYFVRGSNVNLCTRHHPLVDSAKQTYAVHYDRCSPSLLAFANREAAEAFAREHGGTVLPFAEYAAELRQ